MRLIRRGRGQHQFGVGGDVDLSRATSAVGKGDAPRLGIVFGRDDNLGHGGQFLPLVGKGGVMFAKDRTMAVRRGAGGLHARGPDLTRCSVAQEDE